MKTVLLAALLLLAVGAQADLVAEAPAAQPLAPAPAPSAGPMVDVPCPAPAVLYSTLDECDQAIAAGLDVAKEQGVDLASLEALGIEVPTNTTRSTTISSSTTINGQQSVSIKYKRVIFRMDPTVYCCGLTVATSTGGNTAAPNGVATTSAAAPTWGLRSFAAAAALATGAAALVM